MNLKNLLLGAIAFAAVAVSSCKKDDDSKTNTPSNTWTIGGATYTASSITRSSQGGLTILTAASATADNVAFYFDSAPVSGAIKVGDGNGQMAIIAGNAGGVSYSNKAITNVDATIDVDGGKISVTVPDVWMKSIANPADSVKFSGSVREN